MQPSLTNPMSYGVYRLLDPNDAATMVRELERLSFVDGKLTAGGGAREIKNNLQVDRERAETSEADRIFTAALGRNEEFQVFAMPQRFLMPIYSQYEPGMGYGAHIDNSLMGGYNGLRTDLAMTLFLSPPESYDGGELVLHLPVGAEEIKLESGEAIVYPASYIHHVATVTRGIRLAAVTWLQSAVRDERLRAILRDLYDAVNQTAADGNKELSLKLNKDYHNLIRYAAEP